MVDVSRQAITAVKHKLRICNAYPGSEAVEVLHGRSLITHVPLFYKGCAEVSPRMVQGEKLVFKLGDAVAGSFKVPELPGEDAVLVVVIYRSSAHGTKAAFESHTFANLVNAQIAVLDLYQGTSRSSPKIQDLPLSALAEAGTSAGARTSSFAAARSETLRYDTVVAVNPGLYEVVLQATDGELKAWRDLVALNRESYVVVRCGAEVKHGEAYPQDLVVFPQSDASMLMGLAAGRWRAAGQLVAALVVLLRWASLA